MTREIKFRAKSLDGIWEYGDLHLHCKHPYICNLNGAKIYIDENTVGQFTGLHDKNGKEIYEGDIVRWVRKGVHIEGRGKLDFEDSCVVYWNDNNHGFYFRYSLSFGSACGALNFRDSRADDVYFEVIGNIYDNPELLKGGKQ